VCVPACFHRLPCSAVARGAGGGREGEAEVEREEPEPPDPDHCAAARCTPPRLLRGSNGTLLGTPPATGSQQRHLIRWRQAYVPGAVASK